MTRIIQFNPVAASNESSLPKQTLKVVKDEVGQKKKGKLAIIHMKPCNKVGSLNKHFREINASLEIGGTYIGCAETNVMRAQRLTRIFPAAWLAKIFLAGDFILNRVFPKIQPTHKLYRLITGKRNKALSKCELLGRLVYNGFEIKDVKQSDTELQFTCVKVGEPTMEVSKPQPEGIFIKLNRVGHNGETIGVYKLRTMHAYARHLQSYMYKINNLASGGKFKDDFRVTGWGKFMRKCWLDELPMFINVFRGEMRLVGVRPLSKQYLDLYPESLQFDRAKTKPGLIPPYYADMPKTIEEIIESEQRYLDAYFKNPLKTKAIYLSKALYNILIKKARSN